MKVRLIFAWYDFWVGAYWDSTARALYVMVPMVGVRVQFRRGGAA